MTINTKIKKKHNSAPNKNISGQAQNSNISGQGTFEFFPTDSESLAILRERANHQANQKASAQITHGKYCVSFTLGSEELYGISYDHIKEIIEVSNLTMVPLLPSYVEGVINRRGLLLTIINLGKFLGVAAKDQSTSYKNILIVEADGLMIGLLIEEVKENVTYDDEQLASSLVVGGTISPEYVLGIKDCKIMMLNIMTILKNLKEALRSIRQE